MAIQINNVINDKYIQAWGNKKQFIAVHYLGVDGQNNKILSGGYGAHFYVYWDGTIYQACSYDAVPWQVGTGGYYTQLHPQANNYNCIGIEMCVHCDGNANNPQDPKWWFTEETQLATVELVKYLMNKFNIPIQNVLRHGDVVNKHCPAPYLNNNKYRTSWTWNEFKSKLTQSQPQQEIRTDKISTGTKGLITTENLNVRKSPNGEIVDTISKDTALYPTERTIGGDFEHYWFKIDKGWVCGGSFLYGWVLDSNNKWWYIENGSAIYNDWKWIDGKCYYFGNDGYLVTNSYIESNTEKGKFHWVNSDGVWIESDDSWDVNNYNVIRKN